MIYYDDDDVISKRLSNRKRLKAKTYDSEFIDNEEQLMLNQVFYIFFIFVKNEWFSATRTNTHIIFIIEI